MNIKDRYRALSPSQQENIWMVTIAAVGVTCCILLAGCVTPTRSQMNLATGEIETIEVGYAIPLTGIVTHTAGVDKSLAGIGVGGWIGLILGGTAALTSVFPKGQAIWKMLFTGGVPAGEKVMGALALPFPVLNSPPAAVAIRAEGALRAEDASPKVAKAKADKVITKMNLSKKEK